jgi:exodeoxyribonuclease VII large subunit
VAEAARSAKSAAANVAEFSISELSAAIKRALEGNFGYVRLRGEISGYRGPHASGHCYFALKDEKAKIDAVIWKGVFQALRFRPEEGMEVVATGKVTSYPNSSKYQIVIEGLEPAGIGALMALLEERKRKLAAEGLFAADRKRSLPFFPRVVGIVTSPTGAVIRDMLHGFEERFPTRVVVWPVRVQGETCAAEVARAVNGFNALAPGSRVPRPDVLIIARGGGSLEDLWGFNEEVVVRAVADSRIPVISAVGHETDWTLIDLVADARAPTPTKAAEWAVPKHSDLIGRLDELGLRLRQSWRRLLEEQRVRLAACARGLPRLVDLIALPRQRFDTAAGRLVRALRSNTQAHAHRLTRVEARLQPQLLVMRVHRARDRLEGCMRHAGQVLAHGTQRHRARLERTGARLQPMLLSTRTERARDRMDALLRRGLQAFINGVDARRRLLDARGNLLAALSYQSALERGFAIVRDETGAMIRSVAAMTEGRKIEVEVADGRVAAAIQPAGTASAPAPQAVPPDQPTRPLPRAVFRPPATRRPGGRSGGGGQGSLF